MTNKTLSLQSLLVTSVVCVSSAWAQGVGQSTGVGVEIVAKSGAVLRIEKCSDQGVPAVVIAKLPATLKLETSTKSGAYKKEQLVGGVFPILEEAFQAFKQSCPPAKRANSAENEADVFLYVDKLPPRGTNYRHAFNFDRDTDKSIPVSAFHQDREIVWVIKNHLSDAYDNAQKTKIAEDQRQQQFAAKASAEKAEVDRKNAANAQLASFYAKHKLVKNSPKGLGANPFAYEGENLMLVVGFEQMQSATTGVFFMGDEGILVVNDIPKGTFIQKGKVVLAAKVIGNIRFDGVVGGLLPVNGMVPNLKYLGAILCGDQSCRTMIEK